MEKYMFSSALELAVLVAFIAPGSAQAQMQAPATGIKRIALQQHHLATLGQKAVQARIEFDSGAAFGRHKRPGEEPIYVLAGSLQYEVEYKPPVTLQGRRGAVHPCWHDPRGEERRQRPAW